MSELTKKLLDLKNCIFEAKQCISTHHKRLDVSTDSSELKYCIYRLFLGSINIHKILQQSQTPRCQKARIWQVPLDYNCQLTNWCVLFTTLQNFGIQILYVFWRIYIVECRMLF